MLSGMVVEARELAQKKEVQAMLLAEKYATADINAMKSYERKEGSNTTLYELVSEGDLSITVAARKADVSEETFRNNMIACGFNIPE